MSILTSRPTFAVQTTYLHESDCADIVLRAMVEWLRTSYSQREGQRIKDVTELPEDTTVLARPPELLDLANGRI
jgi:hypothetical protein